MLVYISGEDKMSIRYSAGEVSIAYSILTLTNMIHTSVLVCKFTHDK